MSNSAAGHVDLSPQARDGPECGGAEQVLRRLQEDELGQHRLRLHIQIHCQVGLYSVLLDINKIQLCIHEFRIYIQY